MILVLWLVQWIVPALFIAAVFKWLGSVAGVVCLVSFLIYAFRRDPTGMKGVKQTIAEAGLPDALIDAIKPFALMARDEYQFHRKNLNHEDAMEALLHNICQKISLDLGTVLKKAGLLSSGNINTGPRSAPYPSAGSVDGNVRDWLVGIWAVLDEAKKLPPDALKRDELWGWMRNYFSKDGAFLNGETQRRVSSL